MTDDAISTHSTLSTHQVDGLLTLHEPNSHEFRVIFVATRRAGGSEEAHLDVRITVDLGWETFDRAVMMFTLFHCPPDVRGDGPEGGLIPGKRVRIEARLDDALAREHFGDPAHADAEAIATRLLDLSASDTEHVLLETESWFALTVTQALDLPPDAPEDAVLREGYRTTWADAKTVSREG